MKHRLGATVGRGRPRWGSRLVLLRLVLLSGAASCPARRESRWLDNTVSEGPLSRG